MIEKVLCEVWYMHTHTQSHEKMFMHKQIKMHTKKKLRTHSDKNTQQTIHRLKITRPIYTHTENAPQNIFPLYDLGQAKIFLSCRCARFLPLSYFREGQRNSFKWSRGRFCLSACL